MSTSTSMQRVLGLAVAAVLTGALLTAVDGYAKHGSQGAGLAANVVQLETVTVTASRGGAPTTAIASTALAAPAAARL